MQSSISQQRGLSIVELMVALVLGLLITSGIIAFYLQSKRNFSQDDLISRMQENARMAMDVLARDLEMTGFWGKVVDDVSIQKDASLGTDPTWTITTDCGSTAGWAYDPTSPINYLADANAVTVNTDFPCIATADLFSSTGNYILAIKHVSGAPAATVASGGVYLHSNGIAGTLYREPATGTLTSGMDWKDWQYQANVYYIGKDASRNDLPVLYRAYLKTSGATPTMETEAGGIAEGIESFRVQFGLDTDNDGVANQYLTSPTTAQQKSLVSARIYLLVRSSNPDPSYTNTKSYNLGGSTVSAFNDHYYRRVYTTTVVIRNTANMLRLKG